MANYALITGSGFDALEVYRDLVQREGLEAVLARDSEETKGIVLQMGRPKLVIADLRMSHDAGFQLLRDVQSSMPNRDRPPVLAAVSPELETTAADLMDALGIAEVLPKEADARAVGIAIRRALESRPKTDPCPPSQDEDSDRLRPARVAAAGLHDSSPDKALDDLVAQTVEAFDAPLALVSLTHDDGHWFKSHAHSSDAPAEVRNLAFDASFCQYIVESGQPVLVSDTTMHPTFAANPLVRSGLVATFAGAPLITRDGDVLGALCILDVKAGAIVPARVDMLARFARRVAEEFELRSKARSSALEVIRLNEKLAKEREKHDLSRASLAQHDAVLAQLETGVLVVDRDRRIVYANAAAGELLDMTAQRMVDVLRDDFLRECSNLFDSAPNFLAKMSPARTGLKAFSCELEHERPFWRRVRWSLKPVELPGGMGQLITLTELERRDARQMSGRYSVVPPLASTRPPRAAPAGRVVTGRGKRKA